MANELLKNSQSRQGATVYWITIHTAEGPTDEFPSRPDLDANSARDLLKFGQSKNDRSWHACCDDDIILDNLVPYDRAAWTLRGGNNYSDNLEMCGLASWSRAEWLTHDGMLRIAAKWVAGRLKARNMTPRRLTVNECARKSARGYMDHWTYTQAYADGTHTDVGKFFPWDVFGNYVVSFFTGGNDEMPSAADVWNYGIKNPDSGAVMSAANRLLDIERRVLLSNNADAALKAAIASVKADTRVTGDDEAHILAALQDLSDKVSALTPTTPEGTENG